MDHTGSAHATAPPDYLNPDRPRVARLVMEVDMGSGVPKLYVKLQLGCGEIYGRSFHYSKLDSSSYDKTSCEVEYGK